jgi:hypothetical protein
VAHELEYSQILVNWREDDASQRVNEHLAARARDGWEMIHYRVVRPSDESFHYFIWRRESQ